MLTLLIGALAVIDFTSAHFNVAIVYVIPLVMWAQMQRRVPYALGVTLIALTFGGYFFFVWPDNVKTWNEMFHSERIFNRFLVSVVIMTVTAFASVMARLRQSAEERGQLYAEPGEELFLSLDKLIIGFVCLMVIFAIAASDIVTPSNFNLPILYAVPMLICPWGQSRRFLWCVVPVVLLLILFGYLWSPPPIIVGPRPWSFATNRTLSAVIVLVIGVTLHVLMGREKAQSEIAKNAIPAVP